MSLGDLRRAQGEAGVAAPLLLIRRSSPTFEAECLPCISRYWQTRRYAPDAPWYRRCSDCLDVLQPLPFPAAQFRGLYLRRILEHLTPDEARGLLGEARRVLVPGGILRLSVPDLEALVRDYLAEVEGLRAGGAVGDPQRHREAQIELIDQMVRTRSGGALLASLRAGEYPLDRLRRRWGDALEFLLSGSSDANQARSAWLRTVSAVRAALGRHRRDPRVTREAHLWMFDAFSLDRLCSSCGFQGLGPVPFDRSRISGWDASSPDTSARGPYPFEPSLCFECQRP